MRRVIFLLLSGVLFAQSGSTDSAAVRKIKAQLAANPTPQVEGQARLELARIYVQKGDWLNAAEQFARLRQLAPNDAEYAYQLGSAYRNASRWALIRMQEATPNSARLKQIEAEQLAVTGNAGKAILLYKEAIAAAPALRGSHLGLAMLYSRSGKRAEALAELAEELTIAPESAAALHLKAALENAGP